MRNLSAIAIALCVIALPARESFAQSSAAAPVANPANASPAVIYESPFANFVPLSEPNVSPASSWRELNQTVGSFDSMSATMDDMPGMPMPPGHDMNSMSMGADKKMKSAGEGMKSMPMNPAAPTGHDMTNMPKGHEMRTKPMAKDMPMGHDMKNMPMAKDKKILPKKNDAPAALDANTTPQARETKPAPPKKDMPMNMDMPGMKEMK